MRVRNEPVADGRYQGQRATGHPRQGSYVRSSAYKAREVLDLIRGKSYAEAAEILQFSERGISEDILKVLDSAVANAEHNDNQVAEELYVSACYADEGRPSSAGASCSWPCDSYPQAHLPHHGHREPLRRRGARSPAQPQAAAGRSGAVGCRGSPRSCCPVQGRQQEAEEDVDDTETTVEDVADEIVAATAAEMEAAAEDDNAEDNVAEADTSTEEEE